MKDWKKSVYSDGTVGFVSAPEPELGEEVSISVQLLADAPVRKVFLRALRNGTQVLFEAKEERRFRGLARYTAKMRITQPITKYRFIFAAEDGIYYYNQQGLTDYYPEKTCDFTLLAEYRRPAFVGETVFYQIFPERFSTGDTAREDDPANALFLGQYPFYRWYGGTLEGVRQRIPYLKELGVNAVYLNPIFTAPSTHKYDCADYFHVDADFGGDEALEALSRELHANGIRLMLDISINHTGRKHGWFRDESLRERFYLRDEETGEYVGWNGVPGLPVLDYRREEVREIVYRAPDSVLRKWLLPPYDIDGWRFDVADVFGRHDEVQMADELWQEVSAAVREAKSGALIVAEDWGDCCRYEQGDAWDTSMNYYGCARPLREFYGVPDLFNERDETLKKMSRPLPAEAFAKQVEAHLSHIPGVFHANQFNLFDSHDIPRLHNMPGMTAELYRGAVILLFLLPGMPSVYYGDEIGIGGGSVGDPSARWPMPWRELGELRGKDDRGSGEKTGEAGETMAAAGRKAPAGGGGAAGIGTKAAAAGEDATGSEAYFEGASAPAGSFFGGAGQDHAGLDRARSEAAARGVSGYSLPERREFFNLYKRLICLRKTSPALRHGSFTFLYAKDRVLAIARFSAGETLIGAISASGREERILLPLWRIGAEAPRGGRDLLGRELSCEMAGPGELLLTLPPEGALLFRA